MTRSLLILAFHAYVAGALLYLVHLARPVRWAAAGARVACALGFLAHGTMLAKSILDARGIPTGLGPGLTGLTFLLMGIALFVDLRYRAPVMGAFLVPPALLVLSPVLFGGGGLAPPIDRAPLLPVHIVLALVGLAAFAVAAGCACLYLVLEREVKGKRFGFLFSRLPSLQFLDELNRRLVVVGFIALSVTAVTGAWFARGGAFWAWNLKEAVTLLAWGVFAGVLNARLFAGWRGRRVALLTVGGFGAVLVVFLSSYLPAASGGS